MIAYRIAIFLLRIAIRPCRIAMDPLCGQAEVHDEEQDVEEVGLA